jgi:hypothetical protein
MTLLLHDKTYQDLAGFVKRSNILILQIMQVGRVSPDISLLFLIKTTKAFADMILY